MKTVLIVDDAEILRLTIKEIVTKNGYEVIGEAGDGKTGVEMYEKLNPDIVTMDVTMSGITGLEALKQIIAYDPDAKIVIISAMGQDLIVKDAIVFGAKSFIVKPFGEQQIIDTFRKL